MMALLISRVGQKHIVTMNIGYFFYRKIPQLRSYTVYIYVVRTRLWPILLIRECGRVQLTVKGIK
jgi:hypothetical protein